MTIQLTIAIAGLLGLLVGLAIGRNARRERDKRIAELEKELTTIRNVAEAQNETIGRLRKKLDKGYGKHKTNTNDLPRPA